MKIADSDGNGLLSYDEVYHLANISMKKNFAFSKIPVDNNNFLNEIVEYLTKRIFEICGIDLNNEIPLTKIMEIIVEAKSEDSDLLLFFCGADFN